MGGHVFWCTMKHLPWKYEWNATLLLVMSLGEARGGGTLIQMSDTLASFLHKIETSSIFTSAVGIDGSFQDVLLTLFVHASTSCDEINVYLINNPTGSLTCWRCTAAALTADIYIIWLHLWAEKMRIVWSIKQLFTWGLMWFQSVWLIDEDEWELHRIKYFICSVRVLITAPESN